MLWFIVALFLNLFALVSARNVAGRDGGEGVGHDAGYAREPTGTGTTSDPATTPQVVFSIFTTATACDSASIPWAYAGPAEETMTIVVTDNGVAQSPGGSTSAPHNTFTGIGASGNGGARRRSIPGGLDGIYLVIAKTDPNNRLFRWSPVNVPEGSYQFLASLSSGSSDLIASPPFSVVNGTDMSCLAAATSTSSSFPTASPSPTTFSSSSTASSPAESTFPVEAVKKVNKGAIAGGVIGGLAIAAAVIAAVLFFRYSSASPRNNNGTNPGFLGKWGNLGSFDSAAGTKGKSSPAKARKAKAKLYNGTSVGLAGFAMGVADPQTRRHHHSQAESMGGMISSVSSHGHIGRTPGGSAEDIGMYSPPEEKYRSPFSDSGHEMMGTIPIGYEPTPSPSVAAATVSHGTKRSSGASSIFTYAQNNNFSRPRSQSNKVSPSPQTFPESPRNTSSATISSRRASSPAVHDNDFLDSSRQPSPAFPSGTSGQAYIGTSYPTPAASPSLPLSPVSTNSRKTPRKPVPTYDPALSGYSDTPVDVSASAENVPHQLVHKDSHGSVKQMHYLIPDLPPPQRD